MDKTPHSDRSRGVVNAHLHLVIPILVPHENLMKNLSEIKYFGQRAFVNVLELGSPKALETFTQDLHLDCRYRPAPEIELGLC